MFSIEEPLTKQASKRSSDSDQTTNLQRDTELPKTFHKHPFTRSYEDDTNITYIDEDSYDDEPKLNYHPMKNEISATSSLKNDKFSSRNAKNSRQKSYEETEYNEEMNLLKKMLPLLEKYKSLNLDKNDINNKHYSEKFLMSTGKTTPVTVMKGSNTQGIPVEKKITNAKRESRVKENRYASRQFSKVKNPASLNLNKENDERSIKTVIHNQNARHTAFPKQSTVTTIIANTTTHEIPNEKHDNVSQTTLHHTKVTNKDGTLEILNKLPSNGKSIVAKPKVIHSKAEAIGEIFKALGTNNRIVKDANGLYLISGKQVKIIHRTHGNQAQSNTFGNNKGGSKTPQKNEIFQPENKEEKFGPDLSRYNLQDLGYKFRNHSKKKTFKTAHNVVKSTVKVQGNDGHPEGTSRVLSLNSNDNPYTKEDNMNDTNTQWKLNDSYSNAVLPINNEELVPKENSNTYLAVENVYENTPGQWLTLNDSYTNGIVPVNINNTELPTKENQRQRDIFTDSYTNGAVPINVNNTEFATKQKEREREIFTDSYTNGTVPLNINNTELTTKDKERQRQIFTDSYTNGTVPINANNTELSTKVNDNPYGNMETMNSNNTRPLNEASKFTEYVSNIITLPENESMVHDYSFNKSLPFGISTLSLGANLTENHQFEHRPLPKTVVQSGQLNSSQSLGDKMDKFSAEIDHISSMNLHSPENILNPSSNIDPSHFVPTNSNSNSKIATLQNKSSGIDEKLSDVHIEVIDEARGDTKIGSYQTATDVRQDSENVEVIDEGASNQPPVKITPQDLSSALQEKFGAGVDRISSKNNWLTNKSSQLSESTEAHMTNHSIKITPNISTTLQGAFGAPWVDRIISKNNRVADKGSQLSEITEANMTNQSTKITPKVASAISQEKLDKERNDGSAKPSVQIAPENATAPGLDNSKTDSSIKKEAKSPKITQPIEEPKLEIPGGPTWTMNVLGTVGRPQTGPLTRNNESGINTNDMTSKKKYSFGINRGNREHHGVLSVNDDYEGTPNDNTSTQGTSKNTENDKDSSLQGASSGNRGPHMTSMNNLNRPWATVPNVSYDEPMIPTRIVDALLWNLFLKSQGRNTERFTMKEETKHLKGKNNLRLPKHESENNKPNTKVLKDTKQKGGPSKTENTNLDKLLEKFVQLISRRIRANKGKKRKPKRKHNISKTLPRVKYQEKLLWDEQRKLEHQLAVEQKLLEKSNLIESSKGVTEHTDSELYRKLQEMNKEKDFLFNKLKMLKDKYKIYNKDEDKSKLIEPDEETEVTEVYDSQHPMNGADIGNDINDREFNKELAAYSELKDADKQLKHLLAEYEATIGTTNREATVASEDDTHASEDLERYTNRNWQSNPAKNLEPHKELDKDFMEDGKHGIIGFDKSYRALESNSNKVNTGILRDQDSIPSSIHVKLEDIKAFTAKEFEDGLQKEPHKSTEYPTYQYNHIHQHQNEDPTNIPNYPTPSFINKEADFASDTVGKFEDLSKLTKPEDENNLDQRKEKNAKTDYGVDESLPKGSRGVQRESDVFPERYSYGKEHDGTESPPQWEKEENLLTEMPEYSSKANTIESETQAKHYTVVTSERNSPAEVRPQVTNIAGPDDNKNSGVQEFRTGIEAVQQPIESEEETATKTSSQNPNTLHFDEQKEDGKFMSVNEEMKQPNALDSTSSIVLPQTSNTVASNNPREPENEFKNFARDDGVAYANSASPQPETNQLAHVHSVHNNMITSRDEYDKPNPQITKMPGSENDDDQDEDESRDLEDNSQQTRGDDVDGAFEVVGDGEIPTLRRNTDNPEDGVEDKTFINGDEYHLQKKYGIAKLNTTSHVYKTNN